MTQQSPYALLSDGAKTALTAPGGLVLGFGPGPGLSQSIFWNRVGSLFSCYRPALAQLTVFDLAAEHEPAALRQVHFIWEPNHVHACWEADGLVLTEDRSATTHALHCRLKLTGTAKVKREWLLFFHGQVQQWAFFDYWQGAPEPLVECTTDPAAGVIEVRQPHPHHGLPEVASLQRLSLGAPLACHGFGLSEGDLRALWHDHGCLASIRLRLGQVGGRFTATAGAAAPSVFRHRAPLYYAGVRVTLKPGQVKTLNLRCEFTTTDEAAQHAASAVGGSAPAPAFTGMAAHLAGQRKAWRRYLEQDVPQLECSDSELQRYWYYVWYVLRANRTAPGAHIRHPFTAPSKYMYWGPWIWDGYFHSLGEMWLKDAGIARDTIRAVLEMQFPNGFIPVCSGANYRMCFHEDIPGYTQPGGGGYASYVPPGLRRYAEQEHPFEAELEYAKGGAGLRAGGMDRLAGTAVRPTGALLADAAVRPTGRMLHNEKTQTPLIGVAAALYCALRGDDGFAREVLPALWAYEEWLWRRRTDTQGRFCLWHGDESGWDDATRHYPVPAKPVDVQVHSIMHRLALAQLARQAGDGAIEHEAYRRANISRTGLHTYWDARNHWYRDFAAAGDGEQAGKRRPQAAASGIFPLLVEQSPRTVQAVLRALEDPSLFRTAYPIPTLAAGDPGYAPHGWGWNGTAWLQVNYFAITGLIQARQYAAADKLWRQTRQLIIRSGKPYSYELYDPELGTGIGCPDYSWQAMVNHLIIHYFAGVPVGCGPIAPCLPQGIGYLRLSNLPGSVAWIELERGKRGVRIRGESNGQPGFDLRGLRAVHSIEFNGKAIAPSAFAP